MSDETKKANSEQPEHNEKLPPPLTAGQPTAEPEVAGRAGSIANDGGQTGDRSSAATAPAASQPAGPELTPPVNPDVAAAETPAPASLEVVAGPEGAEAPSVAASSQSQGDRSSAATAPAAAASQPAGPELTPPVNPDVAAAETPAPESLAVRTFRRYLEAWVEQKKSLPSIVEPGSSVYNPIIKISMTESIQVALTTDSENELSAVLILISVYYRDWRSAGLSEADCTKYFEMVLLKQICAARAPANPRRFKEYVWERMKELTQTGKPPIPFPKKNPASAEEQPNTDEFKDTSWWKPVEPPLDEIDMLIDKNYRKYEQNFWEETAKITQSGLLDPPVDGPDTPQSDLTPRQAEAVRLHAAGFSKAEAARKAGYSESTATKQQKRIFGKRPVVRALAIFRRLFYEQLEQQGMTPERVASALAKQLEVQPLKAIALWIKLLGFNEPDQLKVHSPQDDMYELGQLIAQLEKVELQLPPGKQERLEQLLSMKMQTMLVGLAREEAAQRALH